eukprot:scaffold38634_cov61-Cyclotella_meneghiniana.AAC.4
MHGSRFKIKRTCLTLTKFQVLGGFVKIKMNKNKVATHHGALFMAISCDKAWWMNKDWGNKPEQ